MVSVNSQPNLKYRMSIVNQIKALVATALKELYGQDTEVTGFNESDLTHH